MGSGGGGSRVVRIRCRVFRFDGWVVGIDRAGVG